VIENSERFELQRDAEVVLESTTVTSSARYGLLMIGDRYELRGELDPATAASCVENGVIDVAILGGGLRTTAGVAAEGVGVAEDTAPIPVWTR
jgi:hypothetical protein